MLARLFLATALLVFAADSLPAQCLHNHAMPKQGERLISTPTESSESFAAKLCDKGLNAGWWYKYPGYQLAEHDAGRHVCNSDAPGYLVDSPPEDVGDTKTIKVCFHWDRLCEWSSNITVTNCGSDYVYKFEPAPGCSMAYCFEPTTLTTTTSTTTVLEACRVSLKQKRLARDNIMKAQQKLKIAQDELTLAEAQLTLAGDKVDYWCLRIPSNMSLSFLGERGMTTISPILISAVFAVMAGAAIVVVAKRRQFSWSVHITNPLLAE